MSWPDARGGNLVRTANSDDYSIRSDHLILEVAEASTVYVCRSDRNKE